MTIQLKKNVLLTEQIFRLNQKSLHRINKTSQSVIKQRITYLQSSGNKSRLQFRRNHGLLQQNARHLFFYNISYRNNKKPTHSVKLPNLSELHFSNNIQNGKVRQPNNQTRCNIFLFSINVLETDDRYVSKDTFLVQGRPQWVFITPWFLTF